MPALALATANSISLRRYLVREIIKHNKEKDKEPMTNPSKKDQKQMKKN